jgi:opacity protein-like surface antigen
MNRFLMIAVALSAFLLPAQAQEELQRVEVFAGYQFSHFDPSLNASGWNAAINGNVSRWLGITGDFSGTYKNGGHLYSFMAGPTFSARAKRVTPFAHLLLGGATACGSCDSAFTMARAGDWTLTQMTTWPFGWCRPIGFCFGPPASPTKRTLGSRQA